MYADKGGEERATERKRAREERLAEDLLCSVRAVCEPPSARIMTSVSVLDRPPRPPPHPPSHPTPTRRLRDVSLSVVATFVACVRFEPMLALPELRKNKGRVIWQQVNRLGDQLPDPLITINAHASTPDYAHIVVTFGQLASPPGDSRGEPPSVARNSTGRWCTASSTAASSSAPAGGLLAFNGGVDASAGLPSRRSLSVVHVALALSGNSRW